MAFVGIKNYFFFVVEPKKKKVDIRLGQSWPRNSFIISRFQVEICLFGELSNQGVIGVERWRGIVKDFVKVYLRWTKQSYKCLCRDGNLALAKIYVVIWYLLLYMYIFIVI